VVSSIVRLLTLASMVICMVVVASFTIFAVNQSKRASAHQAQEVLDCGVRWARGEGVETEGMLEYGSAAKALVRTSDGAEMLVVGSRGRGGLAGALLGSVSAACTHHALCPVVVVPPPDRARQSQTDGAEAHLVG